MQFYFLFAVIYMYYIRRLAVESAGKLCRAVRCPVTVDGLTVSDIHGNVRFTPAAVGIIENIAGADLRFRNLCSQVDKALGLEDSVCPAVLLKGTPAAQAGLLNSRRNYSFFHHIASVYSNLLFNFIFVNNFIRQKTEDVRFYEGFSAAIIFGALSV